MYKFRQSGDFFKDRPDDPEGKTSYLFETENDAFDDIPKGPVQARDRHDPVLAVTLLLPIIADQTHKISHPVLQSRPGRSRTVF